MKPTYAWLFPLVIGCTSLDEDPPMEGTDPSTGSTVLSDPGTTPSEPKLPPPALDRIAVVGCSQTRDWVGDGRPAGFEDLTGQDRFSDASPYGGGAVHVWLERGSRMDDFRDGLAGDEQAILLQLCITAMDPVTYDDVATLVGLLLNEVPDVPVYVMPLDVSADSAGCELANTDLSFALMEEAVVSGLALQGPVLDPLYSLEETRDRCHPNDEGARRMTDTVLAWLGEPPLAR